MSGPLLLPEPTPVEGEGEWFTERMHGVVGLQFRVTETLHSEKSAFQQIDVYETAHHGRLLVLDGCVMLTELDEFAYHELLAHVGAQTLEDPKRALVVGGGDGGIVRELLKYPGLEITQAEIDERVVRISQEYLPTVSAGLTDPRVTLAFVDGAGHLADAEPGSLDFIAVDSTDPVGPAAGLISESFYGKAAQALSLGGVFVAQTQSPFYHPTEVCEIFAALGQVFPEVWMYWGVCPSYLGFVWTFCYASHGRRPLEGSIPADAHQTLGTRYYTADVHRGAFALPPFLQACLPDGHPQRQI
jgi:spermidine synthase